MSDLTKADVSKADATKAVLCTKRIAIVAALEREVHPLVKTWRADEKNYQGRKFRFYENNVAVLVCGGIGAAAARRAAEAVIAIYSPGVIYSAGFAGALESNLKVGDILQPRRLIDAGDGSAVNLEDGEGVLVSFASVADPLQKTNLRDAFSAQAVDMEAAAVARAAEARGVKFAAVKAISDEFDFNFPSLERFVNVEGRFSETGLAMFALLRPWLWPRMFRLARNSNRASSSLARCLNGILDRVSAASDGPSSNGLPPVGLGDADSVEAVPRR
jgi:adenosylhomocysteine nucleosidase